MFEEGISSIIDRYSINGILIDVVKRSYTDGSWEVNHFISSSAINHRIDGPSFIFHHNQKLFEEHWYINGVIHRLDGPAKIWYIDGIIDGWDWFIDGVDVTQPTESLIQVLGLNREWWNWDNEERIIFKLSFSI